MDVFSYIRITQQQTQYEIINVHQLAHVNSYFLVFSIILQNRRLLTLLQFEYPIHAKSEDLPNDVKGNI